MIDADRALIAPQPCFKEGSDESLIDVMKPGSLYLLLSSDTGEDRRDCFLQHLLSPLENTKQNKQQSPKLEQSPPKQTGKIFLISPLQVNIGNQLPLPEIYLTGCTA